MPLLVLSVSLILLFSDPPAVPTTEVDMVDRTMDEAAKSYVKLALALGKYDPDYVDAYYGPEVWRKEADNSPLSAEQLAQNAEKVLTRLEKVDMGDDEILLLRKNYLIKQLRALMFRARMISGDNPPFDIETLYLYDAQPPHFEAGHFDSILKRLDFLIPGFGPLGERVRDFNSQFVIPEEKLDSVFQAALTEARKRTAAHLELPAGESFTIEYVKDRPWSGYNWYQGKFKSLIQVNTSIPITIDRAVDLACHEGYPGHHVYNVMLEHHLKNARQWIEFSLYPLFSPQSLIAEGSANFGIEVAFPGEERIAFEKEVLWPLAGLDPEKVETFYEVQSLLESLKYADNEAARGFLDGRFTEEQTLDWLVRYKLFSNERAAQRLAFIKRYRGYVINYNFGEDLVRHYINSRGGTEENPEVRWQIFKLLLTTPRMPSDLALY